MERTGGRSKESDMRLNSSTEKSLSTTQLIAYSALLSAIGILIPLTVPKIIIVPGVMTVTLGSHVAVMLAMFINPWSAVMVTLATSTGFLISTTPVVALRALSHILFALTGSFLARRMLKKFPAVIALNALTAVIHAAAEAITVYLCMFILKDFFPAIDNIAFYIFVLVGAVTLLHSVVDFTIAYAVYLPLKRNRLL